MDSYLHWIKESPLGEAMRNSSGLFPACETVHFIGLSLLFGAMLIIDLRVMGYFRQMSYGAALKLIPFAVLGFILNLVTGVCFIASNPNMYFTNNAFYLKMIAIALAGANALWFTFAEHRQIVALPNDASAPQLAKVMAGASLGIWVLVILLGRLLPTFAATGGG